MIIVQSLSHTAEGAAEAVGNRGGAEQSVPDRASGENGRAFEYVPGQTSFGCSGSQEPPPRAGGSLPPAAQQTEAHQLSGQVIERLGAPDGIDHFLNALAAGAGGDDRVLDRMLDRMRRPDFAPGTEPSRTQAQHPLLGERHYGAFDHAPPTTREKGVRVPVQRSAGVLCPASSP
ncbi:hypothetical protein AMK20_24275 [Streptomyces sp. TSRI0261]|nr:hypothetical protein AMK20_24275 [Streptomyces sp. TSRI0261]